MIIGYLVVWLAAAPKAPGYSTVIGKMASTAKEACKIAASSNDSWRAFKIVVVADVLSIEGIKTIPVELVCEKDTSTR